MPEPRYSNVSCSQRGRDFGPGDHGFSHCESHSPTMDEKTLEALRGSIAKWEKIVAGSEIDRYSSNCPLCHAFCHTHQDRLCTGCPVEQRTGEGGCNLSPYDAWDDYHERIMDPEQPRTAFDDKSRELAQAELDFLKSLLPAEIIP